MFPLKGDLVEDGLWSKCPKSKGPRDKVKFY